MKILFILLTLLLSSCTGKKEQYVSSYQSVQGEYSKQTNKLIDDNEMLQQYLAEDIILQSTTVNHSNSFRTFLIASRRYLILLTDNNKNSQALLSLEKELKNAKQIPLERRDQSFIIPYMEEIETLITELYVFQGLKPANNDILFDYSELNLATIIQTREENSALFSARTGNFGPYLSVNSFKEKNHGTTALISPSITLESGLVYTIAFKYLVRFYGDEARNERLMRFYVGEDTENTDDIIWEDLEIVLGPDAGNFSEEPKLTDALLLKYTDTNIRVKVEYRSDNELGYFPALNLYQLILAEKLND
jgi:hypothetical protein